MKSHPRVRRLVLLVGIFVLPVFQRAEAQQLSPTISEFAKKARGSIQITNVTDEPMAVALEAQGFQANERGSAEERPLDPAFHVRLAASRIELPPHASRAVSFDATPEILPAWFMITCRFLPLRRSPGITVGVELSSIVIISGPKLDVHELTVTGIRDANRVRVWIQNPGRALARVSAVDVSGGHKKKGLGTFILYPHQRRVVEGDWKYSFGPEKVSIRVGGKRLETPIG